MNYLSSIQTSQQLKIVVHPCMLSSHGFSCLETKIARDQW